MIEEFDSIEEALDRISSIDTFSSMRIEVSEDMAENIKTDTVFFNVTELDKVKSQLKENSKDYNNPTLLCYYKTIPVYLNKSLESCVIIDYVAGKTI